jgi:hypothetical protein
MFLLFAQRSVRFAGTGLFLCLAMALPAAAGKFSAKCGSTKIPETDRNGAVCLALCGGGSDSVSCIATNADELTVKTGEVSPLQGPPSSVWIRILGKEVTLGQVADRLAQVSGWKVRINGGFEKLELLAGQWKGKWEELDKMRWKISNAGRVHLSADSEARTFTFSVKAF